MFNFFFNKLSEKKNPFTSENISPDQIILGDK